MSAFTWPIRRPEASEGEFEERLPFPPDEFQVRAFRSLDSDHSVLVSAPTGSGKTLVAAYAIHRCLGAGGKAFYTTPLKALSNQKYGELVDTYGAEHVGLLTGDTAVRADAPVVVMTTEVLRNMLLAGSPLLTGLHTVILDEVHFLQDPYRGGVWEEVLVLSPPQVKFVCLSATVRNANELGGWLRSVRGATDVIVERERPITLRHHFSAHRREDDETILVPLLAHGRAGGEGQRIDQAVRRAMHVRPGPSSWQHHRSRPRLPFRAPLRTELISLLDDRGMLPAIVFIFSRAACDDAVRQVMRDGVRLTDRSERHAIRAIAERRVDPLSDEDLGVLGYGEWVEGLESGVASHHAGLVPVFRETVEECFAAGLLKVVFATETLSLGINMPARSVVIERFTKYGGAGRSMLTSGEYLQLTGRAGRRGLDEEGHAVVLWSTETEFSEAARVASAPPPDLRSAFRPSYNLVVNLASRFDRATATEILHRSFAQWQATRDDLLRVQFDHRVTVLEELGYLKGWGLTPAGDRLARIYHESDLLVAEALSHGLFDGLEPSLLAGVVSAVVFEPRRARRTVAHSGARPRSNRRGPRKAVLSDRLGEKRSVQLHDRTAVLAELAEAIRASEEHHLVPRTRQPAGGLSTSVASWARGASLETALGVAARDVGELAPGDFVRTMKSVADLVQQVAYAATDPATAEAARQAVSQLLRGVVAIGLPSP
ncbi:MAG TPA: DEAD/DEAH box helicase [Acidimicrobiales bacterium]|nr:DEAD/DEAH box helicase [Acidimicrobiales bacterium]